MDDSAGPAVISGVIREPVVVVVDSTHGVGHALIKAVP
jgi:hypothetical protein